MSDIMNSTEGPGPIFLIPNYVLEALSKGERLVVEVPKKSIPRRLLPFVVIGVICFAAGVNAAQSNSKVRKSDG